MPLKDILFKIFSAIDFAGDREKVVNQFLEVVWGRTLTDLLAVQSLEKQEEIKYKLNEQEDDAEKIADVLKQYFSQEEMNAALQVSTKDSISDYLQTIDPALSESKLQNLVALAEQFTTLQK